MANISVTLMQKIVHVHGSVTLKPGMTMRTYPGMTIMCTDFIANGESAKLIALCSSTPGAAWFLSVANGTINLQYCSIQDSVAEGGAMFKALLTNGNLDGGGNTGWNFILTRPVTLFTGKIGEIEIGRSSARLKVVCVLESFNIQWPRNLYTPACGWTLYDAACGLDKADFTQEGAVDTGSTISIINTTLAAADDFYNQGVIRFLTGVLAGVSRTV